jgi:excisionase family DNA binding protein
MIIGIMGERFYTVREISDVLQVHEGTVKRWVREGRIESIKIGMQVLRVKPEAFEQFLALSTSPAERRGGGR